MNTNNFKENNRLLVNTVYDAITDYQTFIHARSVFKDKWYNFIVPSVTSENLDWKLVEEVIHNQGKRGYALSYYISSSLIENFQKYFASIDKNNKSESDFYVYANNQPHVALQGELIPIDEKTLEEFLSIVNICFPEWQNNRIYSEYFFKLQNQKTAHIIQNYIYKVNDQSVGCCGYLASMADNLAYIHNTCVLPSFRRRGYFTNMIKHLSDYSLKNKIENSFALVDNHQASFIALQKIGFTTKHKYYLFDV